MGNLLLWNAQNGVQKSHEQSLDELYFICCEKMRLMDINAFTEATLQQNTLNTTLYKATDHLFFCIYFLEGEWPMPDLWFPHCWVAVFGAQYFYPVARSLLGHRTGYRLYILSQIPLSFRYHIIRNQARSTDNQHKLPTADIWKNRQKILYGCKETHIHRLHYLSTSG